MKLNITVIENVAVSTIPTAKGSYQQAVVAYRDLGSNKLEQKKIMDFANKAIWPAVTAMKQGKTYEVVAEKGEKYWNWVSVTEVAGAPSASPSGAQGSPAPRSNYETPDERAQRQRYIVRQSSISAAISLLKTEKVQPAVEEVLSTAQTFYEWVMSEDKAPSITDVLGGAKDMRDDIPE